MSEFPEVLTAREAADALRVSHSHMLKMLREGKIPGVKVGQTYRVPKQVIARMLDTDNYCQSQSDGNESAYTRSNVSGE